MIRYKACAGHEETETGNDEREKLDMQTKSP